MSEVTVLLDTKEWDKFIAKLGDKMKDVGKLLMYAVSTFAYQDIVAHFRNEEGPEGGWAERKEPYKSNIEGKGYTKILQVTGNLRQSITFAKVGPAMIQVIANAPYSGRLNDGSGSMPARPFMWLSDKAQSKIVNAILETAMEGA